MTDQTKLAPPLEPENGWKTINAPTLYSFEKPGETVSGILQAVATVEIRGERGMQRVTQYTLQRDDQLLKLLATYDLTQKLRRQHIGCMVRIKYRGEDASITRNGNAMKVFDVQFKGTTTNQHGIAVTDDDIGF